MIITLITWVCSDPFIGLPSKPVPFFLNARQPLWLLAASFASFSLLDSKTFLQISHTA